MTMLGYTRVSTPAQDEGLQRRALLDAGVPPERIYCDVVTGSSAAQERPAWARLREYARDGDTVVVWRIDRLGRSLIDVLQTVSDLRDHGVEVRSISDGIDPSTPTGRLMLGLLGTLAEYERELIRERVSAGVAAAKSRGVRFGRPPGDDAEVVAAKLAAARTALSTGQVQTAAQAARLVGWSRATFYRHGGPGIRMGARTGEHPSDWDD